MLFSRLMSTNSRLFSGEFRGRSIPEFYAKCRPVIPDELLEQLEGFMKQKEPETYTLCVDVGCGPGNSTERLASWFSRIPHFVGIDSGSTIIQIAQNKLSHNAKLSFKMKDVSEGLEFEDNSVDLITCVESVHWLNLEPFIQECDRVLKPNGVLAIFSYKGVPVLDVPTAEQKEEINERLYFACSRLADEVFVGSNAFLERKLHEEEFRDLVLPYSDQLIIRGHLQKIPMAITVDGLFDYFGTVGTMIETYEKMNASNEGCFEKFQNAVKRILPQNIAEGEACIDAKWIWCVLACRKPN